MKLFVVLLLLAVFVSHSSSQNLCIMCNPLIAIPTDWLGSQLALNVACSVLFPEISAPCIGLFNSINLTSSYQNMYPFIVSMREELCKKCAV
ncbi:hypothetical protein GCK72_002510 [Caenorhabditis remanei]|uniref:Saposin B-type domain-containing protein n=1 Tax=Caenorhabditis remanei TaxID=31234 RepID=A0A6A5HSK7_CAERE|nr:hypothetical protein GCK72_002510 [Caenorhabditis remanei]KAF1770689.1 hypothetical protein GCK72_002510 [Caenorhabditis remanei]